MGFNPASHPINQKNEMKFEKIQNTMSQDNTKIRQSFFDKFDKSVARTNTTTTGPTISGISPDLDEDHMDKEMVDADLDQNMVEQKIKYATYADLYTHTRRKIIKSQHNPKRLT